MEETPGETTRLLDRWHLGDEAALGELLEQHLPWIRQRVHRLLSPLLRRRGDTTDYVQDVVVDFLAHAPRFKIGNRDHFRGLLARVAHAALRDRRRWFQAQRREIARERPLPASTVLVLDPALQCTDTPIESADRRDKEAWIRLGIELLDADDQEVLVLRQWQGLAFSELGVRLGVSEDAARMRFKRALGRLAATVGHLRRGGLSALLEGEA